MTSALIDIMTMQMQHNQDIRNLETLFREADHHNDSACREDVRRGTNMEYLANVGNSQSGTERRSVSEHVGKCRASAT